MEMLNAQMTSAATAVAIISIGVFIWSKFLNKKKNAQNEAIDKLLLTSVNFHFSRKCNYECGFCFHTAKSSNKLPLLEAKNLIKALKDAGFKKINFAGGEPFLPDHTGKDNYLGELVKHAKETCGYESVSIISNAFFIQEKWFEKYHKYLDMLGVSCDSANNETNIKIGRGKNGGHTLKIKEAAALCHKYRVMFKLNTVVNSFNAKEDMSSLVDEINPMRWKLFQVLGVEGENNGVGAKRDVGEFLIEKEEFYDFVERHRKSIAKPEIMRIEDNDTMRSSYVLVDENGCFLDCSEKKKTPTSPILKVGVQAALTELTSSKGGGFDGKAFTRRDGAFFQKESGGGAGGGCGNGTDGTEIEDLCKK